MGVIGYCTVAEKVKKFTIIICLTEKNKLTRGII